MFVSLLAVTLVVLLAACALVVRVFRGSIAAILDRLVGGELSAAWKRYLVFAIYVVGISGGVRIWDLEKYITARGPDEAPIVPERFRDARTFSGDVIDEAAASLSSASFSPVRSTATFGPSSGS